MKYEIVQLEEKTVAGLTARTGNLAPDCTKIIGGLWQRFMGDGIYSSMKNLVNGYTIGLYSDYDFTDSTYDVTVGAEVSSPNNGDFSVKTIPAGKYAVFFIQGDIVTDVAKAWEEIWSMSLNRSFAVDFEEYLDNDMKNAQVKIYVALKDE